MGAVIAIDLGRKKSGFASTDPLHISTSVLDPVRAQPMSAEFMAHLEALIEERRPDTLLMGLPLDEDGTEGRQTAYVRDTAGQLERRYPEKRILLYDERYTSKAAEELIRESGIPRTDMKRLRDSFAALVILRDWLDSGEPDTREQT